MKIDYQEMWDSLYTRIFYKVEDDFLSENTKEVFKDILKMMDELENNELRKRIIYR